MVRHGRNGLPLLKEVNRGGHSGNAAGQQVPASNPAMKRPSASVSNLRWHHHGLCRPQESLAPSPPRLKPT